jgi:hypothetical protein
MRKILVLCLFTASLFAMGSETIEKIALCYTKNDTYMVTISKNETEGRAIWIDSWNNLYNSELSHFVPVQNNSSFKTLKDINKWMTTMFGRTNCVEITYEDADLEYKRQGDERRR